MKFLKKVVNYLFGWVFAKDQRCECGNPFRCDTEIGFLAISEFVTEDRIVHYNPEQAKRCYRLQQKRRELQQKMKELNIGG